MTSLEQINRLAAEQNYSLNIESVEIEEGAISKLPEFLASHDFAHPVVVADQNTYKVAGKKICEQLSAKRITNSYHILDSGLNDQVVADEQTLVPLFVEAGKDTDVFIAVGSGTIHDIVRFASFKMGKPFVSVPTAASVDGFTSRGAPLILRGVKQTIQAKAPIAVFADVDVLIEAPAEMTAAGFGDILGKYTSLLDWKISHMVGGEPYDAKAAEMTRRSLKECVSHVKDIAARDVKGIKILMNSLIESGLVMLLLGHSRPASGGEHHLSHYWEMEFLRINKRQPLHGAKVGVTTTIITDLYKKEFQRIKPEELDHASSYGKKLSDNMAEIQELIEGLPDSEQLQQLLKMVGGPTIPKELGVEEELVRRSLNEAFHLRDRCTGLFLINQFKGEKTV